MSKQAVLYGQGKGGGDQRAPVEHANDLFSTALARIVDLLGEGEIVGLKDRDNIAKSIYFDDVPLQNADGSFNFEGVTVTERVGTPDQDPVEGFDEIESSISINQEVKDASSPQWVITDPEMDAMRLILRLPALYMQNTENGDLLRHSIGFKLEVLEDGAGSWTELINTTIEGKTNSPYQRAYRIELGDFADAAYPLTFKVSRTTAESEATTTQDSFFVDSYIELYALNLSYPDSAYVALTIDAEQFGGRVPRRSYLVQGLKIRVPSNYDPDTRTYTGLWDGTTTVAYTNNPAYILWDILTNTRYGLGFSLTDSQVDKAAIYQAGVYCDELVPDGKGGEHPRFTLNAVITERKEAYTVIQAICSVFRSMSFWSAGGVSITWDSPQDVSRIVAPENVIDGNFEYSGVSLKAQHSAVLVTWNDPNDLYKQRIEVVEDADRIARFGWRQLELVAYGCTNRAQALRMGRWVLDTEQHETETVTFTAGFDHADVRPGEILKISDPSRVGARVHGRVLSSSVISLLPDTVTDSWDADDTFDCVTAAAFTGPDEVDRESDAAFACTIQVPATAKPLGTIFEAGSSTIGTWLGFDDNGDLILRAGDGASSPAATNVARLVIPTAQIPRERDINIYWDIRVDPGRVRLWINSQYLGEAGTSDGSSLSSSAWADSNGGAYGTVNGTTVAGEDGSFTQDVTTSGVLLQSGLQYFRDDAIWTPTYDFTAIKESFVPGQTILSVTGAQAGGIDRTDNALLWFAFKTPAAGTPPEGCLLELGKGPLAIHEALYVGFDGNGDFVFHAGAAGPTPDDTESARITVAADEWLPDTQYHITLNIIPDDGIIRLWINHKFYGEAQTSDFTAFQNGQFAQGESGSYGEVYGQTIVDLTGDYDQPFNGTLLSSLDYNRQGTLTEGGNGFYHGSVVLDQDWTVTPGDQLLIAVQDNGIDVIDLYPNSTGSTVYLIDAPTKPIPPNAMFIIKSSVSPEQYRVISNREADTHQFEITALRYDPTKFDRVEQGLIVPAEITSLLPTGPLLPPTGLVLTESLRKDNAITTTRLDLSWTPAADARARMYRVEAKSPSGNWEVYGMSAVPNFTIPSAEAGSWDFRVTSVSEATAVGHLTSRATLLGQTVLGKTQPPANVTNLIALRSYVAATLSWDAVADIDLVGYEIRQGETWDGGTVIAAMHVSTQIVIPFETTDSVTFHVRAVDELGLVSVSSASVTTTPPALSAVSNFAVYQVGTGVRSRWDALQSSSLIGYELRYGPTSGDWDEATTLDETPATQITSQLTVAASTTYRFYVKPYVKLASGDRFYGSEATFDRAIHPRINGNIVKTQNEHTAWGGEMVQAPDRSADETFQEGDAIIATVTHTTPGSDKVARKQHGTFRVSLTVSSTGTPTGCIWEMGSAARGGYLGFDGNGDLIFRGGDDTDVNDRARLVVANASIPTDQSFTILCDIQCNAVDPLRVRLWIDGQKMGEDQTDDASAPDSWSSSSDGQYKGNDGTIVSGETGAYGQDPEISNVTLDSDLEYWANTLVDECLEVTGSDELALKADCTFGAYRYLLDLTSEQFVRLWYEATAVFLAVSEVEINDWDAVEINDVDFPITPVINPGGAPNIQYFLEFSPEVPFEQADYKFTTVWIRVEFRRNSGDTFRPALSALTTYADLQSNMT